MFNTCCVPQLIVPNWTLHQSGQLVIAVSGRPTQTRMRNMPHHNRSLVTTGSGQGADVLAWSQYSISRLAPAGLVIFILPLAFLSQVAGRGEIRRRLVEAGCGQAVVTLAPSLERPGGRVTSTSHGVASRLFGLEPMQGSRLTGIQLAIGCRTIVRVSLGAVAA
jgi:hypothetical protein